MFGDRSLAERLTDTVALIYGLNIKLFPMCLTDCLIAVAGFCVPQITSPDNLNHLQQKKFARRSPYQVPLTGYENSQCTENHQIILSTNISLNLRSRFLGKKELFPKIGSEIQIHGLEVFLQNSDKKRECFTTVYGMIILCSLRFRDSPSAGKCLMNLMLSRDIIHYILFDFYSVLSSSDH